MKKNSTSIKCSYKYFIMAFFLPNILQAQFIVSGYVYQPDSVNPAITAGFVLLFKYDTALPVFPVVDSVNIDDINSSFMFSGVSQGSYLIKAYPDKIVHPGTMPSYYGDTVYWTGANIISVDTGNVSNLVITVKKFPQWTAGTNYCSGTINFGTGKTSVNTFGDPVPGIDVSLQQIPGGVMRSTTTNSSGMFSFGNIPDNTTYIVVADKAGIEIPDPLQITMTVGDTINNLNYNIDTANGTIIAVVRNLEIHNEIKIFPNPNDGMFQVTIDNLQLAKKNEVKIYDILGEIVYSRKLTKSNEPFSTNLKSGVYFVKISNGEKILTEKIIVQ